MVETVYHLPGAPRLAFLADLHGRPYFPIITALRSHAPDLICIAGDIVFGSFPEDDKSPLESQNNVLPFLEECAALAPSYLSLGNHEWMLDEDDLKTVAATGVTVLDNRWVERDGVVIAGLTSGYVTDYRRFVDSLSPEQRAGIRYPRKEIDQRREQHAPDTSWLPDFCSDPPSDHDAYRILLSHHPEVWPLIKQYPFDLCLSAHAHGGQIRLFNHGLWSPGQGFWPRWTKGVYEDGRLIVSAGLSNTASVPRLFNPTEVVYVESRQQ